MDRNRYPRRGACGCGHNMSRNMPMTTDDACLCSNQPISLAMSYVKKQPFGELYSPCEGWRRGTIFPDLDKPFCAGGNRR